MGRNEAVKLKSDAVIEEAAKFMRECFVPEDHIRQGIRSLRSILKRVDHEQYYQQEKYLALVILSVSPPYYQNIHTYLSYNACFLL